MRMAGGRLRADGRRSSACGWPWIKRSSTDGPPSGRTRMALEVVCGWRLTVPDGQRREVGAIGVSAGRGQTPWSAARPRSGGSSVFFRTTHDVGHNSQSKRSVRRRRRWAGARACTNALWLKTSVVQIWHVDGV